MDFIIQNFNEFLTFTGFANASAGNLIMILVGALFIWLAIKKDFEPLLREVVGGIEETVSLLPVALVEGIIPLRCLVAQRTSPVAERHATIHAT